ncbi:MAG: class A beta-lactamase [Pseudomonadales bacterium]
MKRQAKLAKNIGALFLFSLLITSTNSWADFQYVGNKESFSALTSELKRLGELSRGVMGVSVIHLETDVRVDIRGEQLFPMASTYKVPTAVTLLKQVDQSKRNLTDMVEVEEFDMVPSDGITARFTHPGIALSLHNLLESMLTVSDNTATDVLMEEVGGPAQITATISKLGVSDIQVSRNTARLIRDYFDMQQPPAGEERSLVKEFNAMSAEEASALDSYRSETFVDDSRDTATPNSMANLLKTIWQGKALSPGSTELLKDIMRRCETGNKRLKGLLPAGTEVAHKTGTIGGTSNDVGVITLPDNKGHLVAAVYIKKSVSNDFDERDRAIAEVARAVHDYFVFNIVK